MASPWHLRNAAYVINAGRVIAYPTEAVFGLGCDPYNRQAVESILALKGRSVTKGVILLAANFAQIMPFIAPLDTLPIERIAQIHASWPGHVTWILPARADVPYWLTKKHQAINQKIDQTIAVRITAHPTAAALCLACKTALVSTSANRSGQPPLHTILQVRRWLQRFPHTVDYILPGVCDRAKQPSQIIDAISGNILR
ncbi:hypothetical protein TI05_05150 [Achromatium sp. WMS3]|nr:hypothetical protein TI05_05150 [Achromatium sp. WMS3]